MSRTYILVDGENIDATLGMSVLGHRPESQERPRWDKIYDFCQQLARAEESAAQTKTAKTPETPNGDTEAAVCAGTESKSTAPGFFFLNATNGQIPMNFVQALISMQWRPLALAATRDDQKVVDLGIQKFLNYIIKQPEGDVILISHDSDYVAQVRSLLFRGRRVSVLCFREHLAGQIANLAAEGLKIYDLEFDARGFTSPLPRISIIPIDQLDPSLYIGQ